MPTYNYGCDACGHEFEREQRISDKPIKKCPECGKAKARRMITSANFILKGSGWYADGYDSAAKAKKAKKDEAKPDSTEAKSDSKASESSSDSEAKPAKKKKAKSGEAGSTA